MVLISLVRVLRCARLQLQINPNFSYISSLRCPSPSVLGPQLNVCTTVRYLRQLGSLQSIMMKRWRCSLITADKTSYFPAARAALLTPCVPPVGCQPVRTWALTLCATAVGCYC